LPIFFDSVFDGYCCSDECIFQKPLVIVSHREFDAFLIRVEFPVEDKVNRQKPGSPERIFAIDFWRLRVRYANSSPTIRFLY
jgi:hypothetical protein